MEMGDGSGLSAAGPTLIVGASADNSKGSVHQSCPQLRQRPSPGRYHAAVSRSSALSIVRAAVGVGVLATIAVQMSSNMDAGTFNPTRFFAFFTIESNLYGAILFLFLAARRSASGSVGLDLARGASVGPARSAAASADEPRRPRI